MQESLQGHLKSADDVVFCALEDGGLEDVLARARFAVLARTRAGTRWTRWTTLGV